MESSDVSGPEYLYPPPADRRLAAQLAVSAHIAGAADLAGFFGLLTATIAELVGAEGALVGRLNDGGDLVGQPNAHGVDPGVMARLRVPCAAEGTGLAERVVHGGQVFRGAIGASPAFDPYRDVIEALGLRDAVAVPWRDGETHLGLVLAYNSVSPAGFSDEDAAVLVTAAHAAALVWQSKRFLGDLQLQRAITANMAEGVLVTRVADSSVLFANSTLSRMFGYSEGELEGHPTSQLYAPGEETPEAAAARIAATLRDRGTWSGEIRGLRKDGTSFWSRAIASHLDHPEYGEIGIAILSDVSAEKRAVDVLASARDAAEAASKAKSEYLSRMSHELRTPLTAIIGFSDLLLMEEKRDRSRESLEAILRAGEHLLAIINDILDIARIEAGRVTLSVEPVLLDSVIEECLSLIGISAASRGMRLVAAHDVAETWVLADAQRLKQAILNLLSNAVKYGPEDGEIGVTVTAAAAGRVRLAVRDQGTGIEPERLPMLFQPFERLGAERTAITGTGLGLALSRQLVEAMGGDIGADSVPGKGSTFWMELNASQPPQVTAEGPDEIEIGGVSYAPAAQKTVLYVEDNLATIGVMQRAFARRPAIRLLTAMQGRLAVELAGSHHPDLVIVDLHLPDIDGDEVLLQLRSSAGTRQIPVVVLSADATQREMDRLLGLGAYAYLTKPVRVRRFLELLDEILQTSSSPRVES